MAVVRQLLGCEAEQAKQAEQTEQTAKDRISNAVMLLNLQRGGWLTVELAGAGWWQINPSSNSPARAR